MNYLKAYENLILRAQNRTIDGYIEKHHIIPKCLKGTNDPSNIVALTPEEHYLAHLLLVKIHPGNRSLIYAAKMMAGQGNNKSYGWLRRESSRLGFTEEHKRKLSEAQKGRRKDWTLEQMQAVWKKNDLRRQLKKDQAIITAVIYALC